MVRVLIVDDDPVIRRLLQVNFRLADFEVDVAGGGEEALSIMASARPDIVVMDVTMPDVDGFQVVRRMREDDRLRDVHVVILSARSSDADQAAAEQLGAAAYLTKPFDPAELIDIVREATADIGGAAG